MRKTKWLTRTVNPLCLVRISKVVVVVLQEVGGQYIRAKHDDSDTLSSPGLEQPLDIVSRDTVIRMSRYLVV